jgi:hypothetical protein
MSSAFFFPCEKVLIKSTSKGISTLMKTNILDQVSIPGNSDFVIQLYNKEINDNPYD